MSDSNIKKVPLQLQDIVQGDDGEMYHLRALYCAGQLSFDSAAYRIVSQLEHVSRRLTA